MLPFKIVLPSRMAPYMPHQQLLRPYWENRSHLTIVDELLQYDDRILVPRSMRLQILDCIHTGHLGLTKCRSRARTSVWWPGPSTQIGELIIRCHTCAKWTTNAERTTYTFVLPTPTPPPLREGCNRPIWFSRKKIRHRGWLLLKVVWHQGTLWWEFSFSHKSTQGGFRHTWHSGCHNVRLRATI